MELLLSALSIDQPRELPLLPVHDRPAVRARCRRPVVASFVRRLRRGARVSLCHGVVHEYEPCRSNACTRATTFIATAQLPNVTAHVIARNREETTAEDAARRHRKAGSTDWLLLPAVLRQANDVAAREHADRRAAAF